MVFARLANGCDKNFVVNFSGFDCIVAPSGSCVLHIKEHLHDEINPQWAENIRNPVCELPAFLTDLLKVKNISASFAHKVSLHTGFHGQWGLHLPSMSELIAEPFSKPKAVLGMVKGLELSRPKRDDECCGFGGTFCVFEEAVSAKMGEDRIKEHEANAVEYITSADFSCLMHREGILKRNKNDVKTWILTLKKPSNIF